MLKVFYPLRCKVCNVQFQPVDWLRARRLGFCDSACEKVFMNTEFNAKLTRSDVASLQFACEYILSFPEDAAIDLCGGDPEIYSGIESASMKLNGVVSSPAV